MAKAAVVKALPEGKRLELSNGKSVAYQNLIVCPGLRLAWEKIEGLEQTPFEVLHVPATWHWSLAVQITGFVPVQTPF